LEAMVRKPKQYFRGSGVFKRAFIGTVFLVGAVTFLLSTPLPERLLFDELQIYPALMPSALASEAEGPPTAIVILAAGRRSRAREFGSNPGNDAPDDVSLERIRYGAFVAKQTGLPVLVSGGALLTDRLPLARLLADALQSDYGIESKWVEDRSANTAENAMRSAEILKQAGISRVLLVTHAWHMKRAVAAFSANGLTVKAAPTAFYLPGRDLPLKDVLDPSLTGLLMSGYAIHEIVGGVWYRLRYGY
jgi:uncharacterized SAM-binding protein YcdF (DUF218 family)